MFPQLVVFSYLLVVVVVVVVVVVKVVMVLLLLLLLLLFLLPADLSISTTWPVWPRPAIHVSSTGSNFLFAGGGDGGEGGDGFTAAAAVAAACIAPASLPKPLLSALHHIKNNICQLTRSGEHLLQLPPAKFSIRQ